ncbi:hypothetical protein THAOC_29384, partial [Thalassiosira oceanica]
DYEILSSDAGKDFEICLRYVGTWPTSSPTISPRPTASPTMGPTLTPSAGPSSPPTLRPSQPPQTSNGAFELEGLGRERGLPCPGPCPGPNVDELHRVRGPPCPGPNGDKLNTGTRRALAITRLKAERSGITSALGCVPLSERKPKGA